MDREKAKESLPIMQAFAEGKEIEMIMSTGEWCTTDLFCPDLYKYRIKPEPKYRPFKTKEECWDEMHKHPDLGWVMNKSKDYLNITEIFFNGINFPPYDIGEGQSMSENYDFNKSFSHFTFIDGEPFGVKEE